MVLMEVDMACLKCKKAWGEIKYIDGKPYITCTCGCQVPIKRTDAKSPHYTEKPQDKI